jgi:hypothetical protein
VRSGGDGVYINEKTKEDCFVPAAQKNNSRSLVFQLALACVRVLRPTHRRAVRLAFRVRLVLDFPSYKVDSYDLTIP